MEDDVFLFRGNPNVAMQNKIQIHNRWNMEFDTEDMYWFDNQISTNKPARLNFSFFLLKSLKTILFKFGEQMFNRTSMERRRKYL